MRELLSNCAPKDKRMTKESAVEIYWVTVHQKMKGWLKKMRELLSNCAPKDKRMTKESASIIK